MTDKKTNVDFGVGGIFKGIADLLDAVGELVEKGEEFRRGGKINIGREVKEAYGVTIKTAIKGDMLTLEAKGSDPLDSTRDRS